MVRIWLRREAGRPSSSEKSRRRQEIHQETGANHRKEEDHGPEALSYHGGMIRVFLLSFCLLGALAAQSPSPIQDGEHHGDAPFLLEQGWKPLLNGSDLTGWHAQDPDKPNEWYVSPTVFFDRLLGPTRLTGRKGAGPNILNGPTGRTVNLVTDDKHGDIELYIEWMVSKGSNSGVYLQGLYEVQVFDSFGSTEPPTSSDAGGIYHRWIDNKGVGGSAPRLNASRPPGHWQSYQIWFRAPRFDASGKKTENAKFLRVLFNGTLVQENVECEGPTRAHMPLAEAALNPLMLQGDHGPVAYRNIYWRPLRPLVHR